MNWSSFALSAAIANSYFLLDHCHKRCSLPISGDHSLLLDFRTDTQSAMVPLHGSAGKALYECPDVRPGLDSQSLSCVVFNPGSYICGHDGWVVLQNRVHSVAQRCWRRSTHLPTAGKYK